MLEKFDLPGQIDRLDRADLLYLVVSRFCDIDLHPDAVSNLEMGYLYEELVRRFSELSNETAGEHFTPREVIRLMVNLLFAEDDRALAKPGVVTTLFDPACAPCLSRCHFSDMTVRASVFDTPDIAPIDEVAPEEPQENTPASAGGER